MGPTSNAPHRLNRRFVAFCQDCGSSLYWVPILVVAILFGTMVVASYFLVIRRTTGTWAMTFYRGREKARQRGIARRTTRMEDEAATRSTLGRPRTRNSRRRHRQFEADADPVPTYYPSLSNDDLDLDPPPYAPPKAMIRCSAIEEDGEDTLDSYEMEHVRSGSIRTERRPSSTPLNSHGGFIFEHP